MIITENNKEVSTEVQKHFVTIITTLDKLDWYGDVQTKHYEHDLQFHFHLKDSETKEDTHRLTIVIKFNDDLNEICTELYTTDNIQENDYIVNKFLTMLMNTLGTDLYEYETNDSCTERPYNYPIIIAIYSIHTFFNIIPVEQGY